MIQGGGSVSTPRFVARPLADPEALLQCRDAAAADGGRLTVGELHARRAVLDVHRADVGEVHQLTPVHSEEAVLTEFERISGCAVVVNTSFNVRGEPIICTPEDAYRCFMRTDIDYLVIGNYLLAKGDQPEWKEEGDWRDEFALD